MSKLKQVFISLLVPISFIVFVIYTMPIKEQFQFNNDEGLNLLTAFMYSHKFSLYTDIWHDQPPIFPIILSSWLTLFGHSAFTARILVLIFSAILVWSFYQIMCYFLGIVPALVSTLLLVVSRDFFKLSASAMVGIPCISLVMLSIYTLIFYAKRPRKVLLFLSGSLLAISLQTKLFSIIFIPSIICLLLYFNLRENQFKKITKKFFLTIFLWLATTVVVYLLIGILFNSLNYEQLWEAHDIGETNYGQFYNINLLKYRLAGKNIIFSLLSFLGILVIFVKRRWEGIFPLAWLITALVFLLKHQPIWYHHYVIIFIPLAWLSGYAVVLVVNFFQKEDWYSHFKSLNIQQLFLPCTAAILLISSMNEVRTRIPRRKEILKDIRVEAVDILSKHRESTKWIFTDSPIIAFYAKLFVPPEIAFLPNKRFLSGSITLDEILLILQKYRPEQIVLSRKIEKFKAHPGISAYLQENYTKTHSGVLNAKEIAFEHYLINKLR